MQAKRKTESVKPPSHLELIREMNLTAISHLDTYRDVVRSDGSIAHEWLPRDIIGADGKTLIVHRVEGDAHNAYNISGWDPSHDGMFGGMREDILSALVWLQRARDIRAGRAKDFLGA